MTRHVEAANIVGLAEVCEIIGFSDGYVTLLLKDESSGFPQPIRTIRQGRLWDAQEVRTWRATWDDRQQGKPGPKPRVKADRSPEAAEQRRRDMDALLGKGN